MLRRFVEEVVDFTGRIPTSPCESSFEEWQQWLASLTDLGEWATDEDSLPCSFSSVVGEISRVTIYRLSGADAAAAVLAERARQLQVEGWSPEHDDQHAGGAMAEAAVCYITGSMRYSERDGWQRWPWSHSWWKPRDKRRNLVRAAALLLAEIERVDRAAARKEGGAA